MASPGGTKRMPPPYGLSTSPSSSTSSSSSSSSTSPSAAAAAYSPSPLLKLASHNLSPRPTTPASLGRSASPPLETAPGGGGAGDLPPLPRLTDLYDLQQVVGQGAYGVVWLAVDRRSGQRVAVKKIADVFGDTKEAKRTLREVRLMRHFRGSSPYILAIHDLLPELSEDKDEASGDEAAVVNVHNFRHLYVVTEFMDGGDLSRFCNRSAPGWTQPDETRVKAMTFGLLSGLRVIHKARVLHRDLRPKNLLIGGDTLKIADFGMGRGKAKKLEKAQNRLKLSLMEFVSNRYYTAPEGLLPNNEYSYPGTHPRSLSLSLLVRLYMLDVRQTLTRSMCLFHCTVDVWAVGCIVVEMLLGYNVFKDSRFPDQMRTVISVLGTPTEDDIASIASGRNEKFRAYIRTLQAQESCRLWTLLSGLSPDGKDFLRRLLAFNPTERATAEEALGHSWLRDVGTGPGDAPGANSGGQRRAEGDVLPFEGADIEAADEASDLRPLLWREILHYH